MGSKAFDALAGLEWAVLVVLAGKRWGEAKMQGYARGVLDLGRLGRVRMILRRYERYLMAKDCLQGWRRVMGYT